MTLAVRGKISGMAGVGLEQAYWLRCGRRLVWLFSHCVHSALLSLVIRRW